MRSKTSFFNSALLRQGLLRQYWPLWALYALLTTPAVNLPAAVLFSGIRSGTVIATLESALGSIEDIIRFLAPIAGILAGLLAAFVCFGCLFKAREAQFYFALPLKRTSLFWTRFFTGLAALLLPILIAWGVLVCVAAFHGYALAVAGQLFAWLGIAVAAHLFFYALAVCVAALTGHGAAYAVLYAVANFFFWYFGSVVDNILAMYLHGFPMSNSYPTFWRVLSPFVYMTSYDGQTNPALYPIVAAVGVAFSALAYLLFRKRRAEAAGDVMAFRALRTVVVYGFAVCFGVMAGFIMTSITMASTGYGNQGNAPMIMSAFFLLFTAVGYFLARLLAHKSARAMRVHWKGALPLLGAALLCVACLHGDWTGYETRVPDEEDVAFVVCVPAGFGALNSDSWNAKGAAVGDAENISLYAMGDVPQGSFDPLTGDLAVAARAYAPGLFEQPENIRLAIALHEAMIAERQDGWSDGGNDGTATHLTHSIDVIYQLKDGSSIRRQYPLHLHSKDAGAGNGQALQIERMEALYNTAEFREKVLLYPGADPATARRAAIRNLFAVNYGDGGATAHVAVGEDAQSLMDAVVRDLDAGNLGRFWAVPTEDFAQSAMPVVVEIAYSHPTYPESYYPYLHTSVQQNFNNASLKVVLTRDAAHTRAWMEAHGVDLDALIGSGDSGMDSKYGTGIEGIFFEYSYTSGKSGSGEYAMPETAW